MQVGFFSLFLLEKKKSRRHPVIWTSDKNDVATSSVYRILSHCSARSCDLPWSQKSSKTQAHLGLWEWLLYCLWNNHWCIWWSFTKSIVFSVMISPTCLLKHSVSSIQQRRWRIYLEELSSRMARHTKQTRHDPDDHWLVAAHSWSFRDSRVTATSYHWHQLHHPFSSSGSMGME